MTAATVRDPIPLMDLAAQHDPLAEQIFAELRALVRESDFIGGARLAGFERAFAGLTEALHAVGVSNGTDALTLALRAGGVGRGDEVITVAHTFIATAESVVALGATPVFVDVRPESALMDLEQVEAAVSPRTRAIVPVHLYGNPVDLDGLSDICSRRTMLLVQDAAQAHGARWDGRPLADYGDAQSYSFYPGKNLGAWGDAGCVTTASADLAATVRSVRDHGRRTGEKYLHHELGGNFRMDPVQAVVLSAKIPHLAAANRRRRELFSTYAEALDGVGDLAFFEAAERATPVWHLAVVRTARRDALREHLARRGIATGIHYPVPVHRQPGFAARMGSGTLPTTERLAREVLSLPFYPELRDDQLLRVVDEVRRFFA
jgi:dTDP-3-amino-3,4,6-trideoxy-alpha-D-glucose transaminase